ncbi:MAG TPA: COX15/CtaA family protein [Ilumatobacteraceae bacterium]|jgi:cytochrome c oxidase assembly protein subunit 15|nr:COX15/CtaA family protein [Ilumatobacteraceae bacterium]
MDPDRERLTMSLRRYRQIAILTVAGVCFLTVAGAVVRLTGSGLGCDDWPNCNNERFIDVSSGHAAIEQINRLVSGLVGIPTLLMAIGAFRVRPARRGLKVPSLVVLATILGNGVVGGLAVRGDLHPFLVQSHFLLAMLSIGFGLVAIHRAKPEPIVARSSIGVTPLVTGLMLGLGLLVAASLATGTIVTGAGPHAGDETARRYGFDISTVAELHSVTVWIAVASFLALVVVLRRDRALFDRLSVNVSTWMFVAVVQGGIGYVQYFSDIPATLVAAHVAGATALWVVTVQLIQAALEPLERERQLEVLAPETRNDRSISPVTVRGA